MPHRDPETGQFLPGHGGGASFDDIEQFTGHVELSIPAASLAGGSDPSYPEPGGDDEVLTGVEVVDFDELLDRDQRATLIRAQHLLLATANSTSTADGSIRAAAEVSSSPARAVNLQAGTGGNIANQGPSTVIEIDGPRTDDTIDLIGRPLLAMGYSPFSDGVTGVGGTGVAGRDELYVDGFPEVVARFHPRDELFGNFSLEASNISDQGIKLDLVVQHLYGVVNRE